MNVELTLCCSSVDGAHLLSLLCWLDSALIDHCHGSQPVGRNPTGGQMALSQGTHIRYQVFTLGLITVAKPQLRSSNKMIVQLRSPPHVLKGGSVSEAEKYCSAVKGKTQNWQRGQVKELRPRGVGHRFLGVTGVVLTPPATN